ncbi:hypothetical protein [Chitinophaga eiseniae]|uniref:Uncharacterized protein n=1 Tax=Chitinophaga eiseniae TaxID=634771 RepID=A0A847SEH0_9BACT|nr:hypothetical protein [Chitinophaga eiseniae]NLR77355.1 hypothetical protein [Chitinophaga eiseniae]
MKLYSKAVLAFICFSCIYLQADATNFSDTTTVLIIQKDGTVPEGATKVGDVKVTDGGFKVNCGYDHTLEEAKAKAIKAGGNIVKIRELKSPDMFSSCYRLFGEIYYHPDMSGLMANRLKLFDTIMQTLLPDTASYALLYVYRVESAIGAAISYNVSLNDSVACRMRNGSKKIIKIYQTGLTKISARTESHDEVTIDIHPGRAYFVRCAIGMGAFVGRPRLNIIETDTGLNEFNGVKERSKKEVVDDVY